MNVRFGVSPIAWINDDMPELGGDTPVETVLADARDIGFAGVELGGKFPRDPAALGNLLDHFGLALVGGWYSSALLSHSAEAEIEALQPHLSLLKACGCDVFIIAETSNAIHGERAVPLSRTPRLAADQWPLFGERLTKVADYLASEGVRLAYHHHLGTSVERQEDVEAFLQHTGASVGLTLDTGHAALGGVDAVGLIRRVPERIVHIHCKDVRWPVFEALRHKDGSFLNGVLDGMFTAPGDGGLDFFPLMKALAECDYSGWIIVEAEQDPKLADPKLYSTTGLQSLRREAEAAGLRAAA
jgi:inosose dehydratase